MAKKKVAVKKKAKKKVESKELVHVRLPSPVALRRDLLQTTLEVAHLHAEYTMYMKLRKERLAAMKKFSKLLGDIKKEEAKLSKTKLPSLPGSVVAKKKKAVKKVAVKKPVEKHSDIDDLQKELAAIEKKLSSLG